MSSDDLVQSRSLLSYPRATQARGGRTKRLFDVVVSMAALLFLLPALFAIWTILAVSYGGSPIFRHTRIGYNGTKFSCLKFRTMVPNAERILASLLASDATARGEWEATQKLKNDPRITKLGNFLRVTSLDELPQLINVLRGDMSIVGPRPVTEAELRKYGEFAGDYCSARPGITGLWQVSGRSDCSYEQRVALDATYVATWTLQLDFSIIIRTVGVVLSMRGSR